MEKHQGERGKRGQNLTSAAETLDWNSTVLLSDFPTRTKAGASISSYSHSLLLSILGVPPRLPPFIQGFVRSNIRYAAPAVSLPLVCLTRSCNPPPTELSNWQERCSPLYNLKTPSWKTFIQSPLSAEMKLTSFEGFFFLLKNHSAEWKKRDLLPAKRPCVLSRQDRLVL